MLDMIRRDLISVTSTGEFENAAFWRSFFGGRRHVFGIDIARTGDLSSIWINRIGGDGAALAALITLKNVKFAAQKNIVRALLLAGAPGCGDSTGLGMNMCEELEAEFGGSFAGVNFAASKILLGTELQGAFEAGKQLIPLQYPEVKADLAALKKETTDAGRLILSAGKNDLLPDSHADIAWSCALAIHAAAMFAGGPCRFEPSMSAQNDYRNPRRHTQDEIHENRWPV